MAPPSAPASEKRKREPQPEISSSTRQNAKRVKLSHARQILAQTTEKALDKNGDLDVAAFVKAREFEIKALGKNMKDSKNYLSKRSFQQVPKDLRRRTASHNVKRVPKRLRARAAREMKDDNTPTVTSRRRKPTPHQRLRLEKAKQLKKSGALTKKRRTEAKQKDKENPGENDAANVEPGTPRLPAFKKNTLAKPAKPPARYRKRQIHKSWLPTHIFHAKRAHMTSPKEPLWRFAIPLTPTDKCYRTTHRSASSRGCVAWDTSYMATIGAEGTVNSLLGLLRSIGVEETMLVGKKEGKWRKGTRWWEGWIRERDGERNSIAPVGIVWRSQKEHELEEDCIAKGGEKTQEDQNLDPGQTSSAEQGRADQQDKKTGSGVVIGSEDAAKRGSQKRRQKLFIRVHASAFFPIWNEVLKVGKMQRPPIMVEDLRFDIGSIEITGPGSTEALMGALRPSASLEQDSGNSEDDGWVDIDTPEKVWPKLSGVTNPASLPGKIVLGFNVSDPRLHHPPRTVKMPNVESSNDQLLELLASWPPDQTETVHDIFDRTKRMTASRQLASQKAINRRKGDAPPGSYPAPSSKDPQIPTLLMASRSSQAAGQGSWTLMLPWSCVLPVWYSLMHYPLASGGNPRFGGLQEKRQVAFEQGSPWYPADYPGTKAGWEWELLERTRKKAEWEKRPKGKRVAWENVDLGEGRKGEIGMGWACDWERLLRGPLLVPSSSIAEEVNPTDSKPSPISKTSEKAAKDSTQIEPSKLTTEPSPTTKVSKPTETHTSPPNPAITTPSKPTDAPNPPSPPPPPLSMHHLTCPSPKILHPPTSLSTIHLTLLKTGHPTRNARIYCLPTTNPDLRKRWLALAQPTSSKKPAPSKSNSKRFPTAKEKRAMAPHQRMQELAKSLLPSTTTTPTTLEIAGGDVVGVAKPGDADYPHVPGEEDLIGFVTTGNYNLGGGKCEAIGNVVVARVIGKEGGTEGENKYKQGTSKAERHLCIIREAGQSLGRLARWKFV